MGQYDELIAAQEAAETAADIASDKVNQAVADLENQVMTLTRENVALQADDAADEARINAQQQMIKDLNAEVARLEALLEGEEPPPPVDPDPDPDDGLNLKVIFGAATTNNVIEFDKLDAAWGPIRMTREYDLGGGFKPVDQYSWYGFAKDNFKYLTFSADEQKSVASYQEVADGKHDAKIKAMLDSVKAKLPGMQGVICLGNEPNTEIAPNNGGAYRAAAEHLIDKFGYQPVDGWIWGVAFSNYNVFGPGSGSAGSGWLPRRDKGPYFVETHFYGRDGYGDPAKHLGLLMTEMKKHPTWYWGIGEISAQEDPTHTKKGQWFTDVAVYLEKNNGKNMLMFDTNVGGSADIATSENTRKAVDAIAEKWKANQWDLHA